ncbi:type II CAAX endopeptidase family protein [Thalassotalea eurytherma]|uniref:CAAX prenyl protease 2/Lysostaphin resistance protein A-like domain-containing protein n=1 Tax=Thalassotalea eurytherma TaxID=1144278 RepID=A0ABQ6H343_9GAMM|nr:type II CAAX endopeptidase family protein [Thalassotalea eurytherma]GLX82598.1 hypothetical protein theurythT_20500 [Thalassotalea eurytherma]
MRIPLSLFSIRVTEFIFLFVVLPLCLWQTKAYFAQYLLVILSMLGVSCALFLYREGKLTKQWKKAKAISWLEIKPVLLTFLVCASGIAVYAWFFSEKLVLNTTLLISSSWLLTLIFYPLFSVIPQELIFRTFLFHRYKLLFPSKKARMLVSSLCFGFGHVIYGSVMVVVLSIIAGLLFSYRYFLSGNTAIVIIEHTLWGLRLFAFNIGAYFSLSSMTS